MFSLIPRERVFFELFEKAADNVHAGARALADLLKDYGRVKDHAALIKKIEHQGDEITHETFQRINSTFITPLDREDIHRLISRLDDILDLIDNAAGRMVLYKIEQPTEEARALGRVLVESTKVVAEAVRALRHLKQPQEILKVCVQIHTYENEGDSIFQHALAALFELRDRPIDVIKWKDIYTELESATDRCEDVANVLESIVLKNA